jgi:hypothetical protein
MLDSHAIGSPHFRFGVPRSMKIRFLVLMFVWASLASSQTADQGQAADAGPTILSRGELEIPPEAATGRLGSYFNFFAYGDFTYNSYEPFSLPGVTAGGEGFDAGVGLNLFHYFQSGAISLNYNGSYRDYPGYNIDPVDNVIQNLSLGINKHLTRHILLTFGETASINPGGWIPQPVTTPQFQLGLNLIAIRNETSLTSAGLSFQQTRRLSWQVGGDFFELRYVPSVDNIGSFGGDASVGLSYRFTKKTSLSATATYQSYSFLHSHGSSTSDSAYLSLSHSFSPLIQVGVSGGALRTTFDEASAQVIGQILLISTGRISTYSPYVSGRFSISRKRVSLSLGGGETVSAGNGIYLTSKIIYAGGFLSYSPGQKWSFALGGGYQRLASIGGGVTAPDEYATGSANYKLTRHFGVRASGSYTTYDTITTFPGNSYYNLSLGIIFTSADRPVIGIF